MASSDVQAYSSYSTYGTGVKANLIEVEIGDLQPATSTSQKGYVFCIDVSGSMTGERLTAAKCGTSAQLTILVRELSGKSLTEVEAMSGAEKLTYLSPKYVGYISIITFSVDAKVVWNNANATVDPWTVISKLDALSSTNLYAGVELTLQEVEKSKVPCTVVIATDGDATDGFKTVLPFKNIYERFPPGTNLITVGIGRQFSDVLINIPPAKFCHALDRRNIIEIAGNVLSEFVKSSVHSLKASFDGIENYEVLVGTLDLGTLFHGRKRTFVVKVPDAKVPTKLTLKWTDFTGIEHSATYPITSRDAVSEKTIRDYYAAEAARMQARIIAAEDVKSVTAELSAWDQLFAEEYKESVTETLRLVQQGKLSQGHRYAIAQNHSIAVSQSKYSVPCVNVVKSESDEDCGYFLGSYSASEADVGGSFGLFGECDSVSGRAGYAVDHLSLDVQTLALGGRTTSTSSRHYDSCDY
jgi:hypothetical protein